MKLKIKTKKFFEVSTNCGVDKKSGRDIYPSSSIGEKEVTITSFGSELPLEISETKKAEIKVNTQDGKKIVISLRPQSKGKGVKLGIIVYNLDEKGFQEKGYGYTLGKWIPNNEAIFHKV